MDLRCQNGIKFGEVTKDFVEVKCRSKRCGAEPGVVVLHRFSHAGELQQTLRFRDANPNARRDNGPSLRSP